MLPSRLAETLLVPPSEQEGRLYADVVRHIRDASAGASPQTLMGLRTLTRLAGSSPAAVAPSLRKRGWDELADHAEAIPRSRKAEVLLGLLHRHLGRGEKVIVFTGFQRTLETASTTLAEAGIPRMPARVFAALLTADSSRVTASELARMLDASPAAVSGGVRYLIQVGMVSRESQPGSRHHHYRVPDDVWVQSVTAIVVRASPWSTSSSSALSCPRSSRSGGSTRRRWTGSRGRRGPDGAYTRPSRCPPA